MGSPGRKEVSKGRLKRKWKKRVLPPLLVFLQKEEMKCKNQARGRRKEMEEAKKWRKKLRVKWRKE